MKIGVDASILTQPNRTGVAKYTVDLLRACAELDPASQIVLGYLGLKTPPTIAELNLPNLSMVHKRLLPMRTYSQLAMHGLAPSLDSLLRIKPDVFFFPNYTRWPLNKKTPSVVVVYDLSFLSQASSATIDVKNLLTRLVPSSVRAAKRVVTISQNSKREIIEHYQTDPAKIDIVYPAVDHARFKPGERDEPLLAKYGIRGKYILYTGTLEPRKNVVGLLEAYAALPEEVRSAYSLVLAGGKGWLDEAIEAKLTQLAHLPIIRTGYMPDDDLPSVYRGADLFAFPSHYEGFGIPPLEAMACGIPVITSDNSSLPEVVGNAGIMVSAGDTPGLTKAMQSVLANPKKRAAMSKQGLEQAQKFTWEASAKKLMGVFEAAGRL